MPTRENKKLDRVKIERFTPLPFIISAFDDDSVTVGFVTSLYSAGTDFQPCVTDEAMCG